MLPTAAPPSHFAENLRRCRVWRRHSQAELAARAGISAKYVGELERDERHPTLPVVERLAGALEVDVAVLVGDPASRASSKAELRAAIAAEVARLDTTELRKVLRMLKLLADHEGTTRPPDSRFGVAGATG